MFFDGTVGLFRMLEVPDFKFKFGSYMGDKRNVYPKFKKFSIKIEDIFLRDQGKE